ncbi:hypothetical protein [Acerihabitans arboris]|uniref:Uncharacterized protein n=1 Tax=Acerihabitans arboris TaxID=2691583 RepID=A0A845SGK6_9GAMM|nr:hypothetical protein [Acerihabitans arboris]NDL62522.1 hypothetical protein [Acerihabitans arboris]
MKLLTLHAKKNHTDTETELMTNDKTLKERQETEMLFGMIKHARNEQDGRNIPSASPLDTGRKRIGLRLLYAYGLLTRLPALPGALTVDPDNEKVLAGLGKIAAAGLPRDPGSARARRDAGHAVEGPDPFTREDRRAARYLQQREMEQRYNKPIINLAQQNNFISGLLYHSPWNMSALDNIHFPQAIRLVDSTLRYLIAKPEGLAKIAYVLLQSSGLYGASPAERLTKNVMNKVVDDWISENVFGSSIETFVARGLLGQPQPQGREPAQGAIPFNVKTCRDMIIANLGAFNTGGAALDEAAAIGKLSPYRYLLDNIITPAMPTLFFSREKQRPDSLQLGTLDWCYLHIGLAFAAKGAFDVSDITQGELIDIGCSLSALMMMGSLSAAMIDLFRFPALLHYLKFRLDKDKNAAPEIDLRADDTQQNALMHFFSSGEAREYAVNPFKQFSDAMSGYQSRTVMAAAILKTRCGDLPAEELARRLDLYKENPDDYHCPPGPDHRPVDYLTDLNHAFEQQNQAIADKYAVVDRLMIMDAMASLPDEEQHYLVSATVRKAGADFSRLDYVTGLPAEYFMTGVKPAVQLLTGIDLFLAAREGEERIFALVRAEAGYWLKRVDRQQENYYALMEKDISGSHRYYRLNIYGGERSMGLYKPPGDALAAVAEHITSQHGARLANALYTHGYDETAQEALSRFLLSFIPFYHCAAWDPHRREEALISCVMDGLNLLPLAGQAATLSSRMAAKVGVGSVLSTRAGLSSFAAGSTLKGALGAGMRTFANLAMASAAEELDRRALIGLLTELARAMDPGMETAGLLGQAAVDQVRNAARLLSGHSPVMRKLFQKLENDVPRVNLPTAIDEYATGRLPGIGHAIPITRLSGDRYLEQPVYVRINPQTGDCFGKKYTLLQDNTLAAVPLPAAKHLRNILRVGLSGRGAGSAAKVWNRFNSVDDMVTEVINGVECTVHISRYGEPGSEALLFPERGITLSQQPLDLERYKSVSDSLPYSERISMRLWTLAGDEGSGYSDIERLLEIKEFLPVKGRINSNLADGVALERWEFWDRFIYTNLLDVFKRPFPRQLGHYLGVGQYPPGEYIPWADTIGPGDIVTNYPVFMSVAAVDDYARFYTARAEGAASKGIKHQQAMMYYKIEGGRQFLPLITGHAANAKASVEYLVQPNSVMRVKSVSTAYMLEGDTTPQRIGIVLEEHIGPVREAKNIYSGETVSFSDDQWAGQVRRYHESLL